MACRDCTTEEPTRPARERHARHMQALRGLASAHASGALGELAGGGGDGLGSLEPGAWSYEPALLDAEAEDFDGRLNAWMDDYARTQVPESLRQQVDAFILRWRELKDESYFFTAKRGQSILSAEAEFNRFRDQVAAYGGTSAIAPSMVRVDGKDVRADQIPAGSSTLDRVEAIAKWGAVIVGGAALLKVASDLGAFKKLGGLVGLGRTSNPRRRRRRNPRPTHLGAVLARSKARLARLEKREDGLRKILWRYQRVAAERDLGYVTHEETEVVKMLKRQVNLINREATIYNNAIHEATAKYDAEWGRGRTVKRNAP
jgi:hypothetical protein